jgi:nucleoside-diphosphate-sugar epimerase
MIVFVIGGNGFVGSAYVRLCQRLEMECHVITRENRAKYVGRSCDVLVNANGNSKKYMADRDPKWEFEASVSSVVASLVDFKSKRYVLLSTGDVYQSQETPAVTGEDQAIDKSKLSRYGLHKLVAEEVVQAVHPSWLIMRLGGFVGPGLKKNAIYDILHGPTIWLHPDSELQFISTDAAARLVWALLKKDLTREIINLGGAGVARIGALHANAHSAIPFDASARRVRFELDLSKLERLAGPIPSTQSEVEAFITSCSRSLTAQNSEKMQ